jgi:glycosyltransferase involved in cell wall biosynthesis
MSYHANISMAKFLVTEIMPKVWAKRPKVQLVIVGKDPTAEVHAFGVDPRITVTGTVNDIRPFLWKATVAVVPLVYGAGIQNKILEAMACGTPVISTSKTLSSIDAIPGKELLVADGANEFANKILEILDDRNLQTKISSAGERYVQRHHDWRAVAYRLSDCYVELLGITQGNQI